MKRTIFLFIVVFSVNSLAEGISSETYEDELVLQLVQSHAREGIVWLGSGKKPFLALYRESPAGTGKHAVIILHSIGMHADWPELVGPLRMQIPESGWSSLSVQLPLLDPGEGLADYGLTFRQSDSRIRTSIRYLRERGYTDIAIIGYSFGATTAINYLNNNTSVVRALVGISMQPHLFLKPKYDLIEELTNIKMPVLDIYAEMDFSGVLKSTDDRRLSANKAGNPVYGQTEIDGANHYYSGRITELVEHIAAWLNKVVVDDEKNR